jgi:dynein heavy chain 1
MKPRHWKNLLNKLNINVPQNEITFGRLWKADLNRNESVFRDIMSIAIGEMVLENMLAKVKEVWLPKDFELVRYQGKCNLIKGWDEMFEQLDEDLNNLASMKLSQYYRTFEE